VVVVVVAAGGLEGSAAIPSPSLSPSSGVAAAAVDGLEGEFVVSLTLLSSGGSASLIVGALLDSIVFVVVVVVVVVVAAASLLPTGVSV